jgi:hypothetical protein
MKILALSLLLGLSVADQAFQMVSDSYIKYDSESRSFLKVDISGLNTYHCNAWTDASGCTHDDCGGQIDDCLTVVYNTSTCYDWAKQLYYRNIYVGEQHANTSCGCDATTISVEEGPLNETEYGTGIFYLNVENWDSCGSTGVSGYSYNYETDETDYHYEYKEGSAPDLLVVHSTHQKPGYYESVYETRWSSGAW